MAKRMPSDAQDAGSRIGLDVEAGTLKWDLGRGPSALISLTGSWVGSVMAEHAETLRSDQRQ